MSDPTGIQWCHSTVNPMMGCDGCELWTTLPELAAAIGTAVREQGYHWSLEQRRQIKELLEDKLPSDVYHARATIASAVVALVPAIAGKERKRLAKSIAQAIAAQFKCYAGLLHLWRGANDAKPDKRGHPGYARKFEEVKLYPGRMKEAASWADLRGTSCPEKPWLDGMPRVIFISDMGDALSKGVEFEYLRREIIENVGSIEGRRHMWLWLTKRPNRMAKFCDWLLSQGVPWPDNLVAMTSVTSSKTAGRVAQLRKVKSRFHALSVEPLWDKVNLDLKGIDWVIVGGESALRRVDAEPFDIEWARGLREQCRRAHVAFFVKQLGSQPVENGVPMKLNDRHGGDWSEWPADLKVREMPKAFHRAGKTVSPLALA
jgi:protein gp37